jgi:very-short-patch-repair endonuclease
LVESTAWKDPNRVEVVRKAREGWIKRLIDLSRRNLLLYYRDFKTGTLDLTDADSNILAKLLNGESVILSRLLPNSNEAQISVKVKSIKRQALTNLEEKGLETLFLAYGMATWETIDEGRPPESPVLLIPVLIENRGRDSKNFTLRKNGDFQLNLVLLHVLENSFGCTISEEKLLESSIIDCDTTENNYNNESNKDNQENNEINILNVEEELEPSVIFNRLTEAAQNNVKGFTIKPRIVLGNFSFQKMAMVKDLTDHITELVINDIIAAIAGDVKAHEAIAIKDFSIDARQFDNNDPENEYLVLDADSSQQKAIEAALKNQSIVIQGPPGTGKSQTIANLITTLVANGRKVLFVAEKRAALEVVYHRLSECGLGHLALDLHGADLSRRNVIKRLSDSLVEMKDTSPVVSESLHKTFMDRRHRLNIHDKCLHIPRKPSGLSVYQLQGKLLRLPTSVNNQVRWRGEELEKVSQYTEKIADLLIEAGGFENLFLRNDSSPWNGALLTDGDVINKAFEILGQLFSEYDPKLNTLILEFGKATGIPYPKSLTDLNEQISSVNKLCKLQKLYSETIFSENLESDLQILIKSRNGIFYDFISRIFNSEYKTVRNKILSFRNKKAFTKKIASEIEVLISLQESWNGWGCEIKFIDYDITEIDCQLKTIFSLVNRFEKLLNRNDLLKVPLANFGKLLKDLSSDVLTPYRIPRLLEIEQDIKKYGAEKIIHELRQSKPNPQSWVGIFNYAWLSSCLDKTRSEEPTLAGFNGQVHEKFVQEFKKYDKERVLLARNRVARAHAEHLVEVLNKYPEQYALVRRETQKKTRNLPLRKLLQLAPDVLTAICPCWMASPLSVSQLLDASHRYFDVVIFDEASQVLPEDAVPSILRASQVIVAGDSHQLPPSNFFVGGDDEEEECEDESITEGFESLLDLMISFIEPLTLEWHYRSKDEALIAFSNHNIYGNRLITFPGVNSLSSVNHVLVNQDFNSDINQESSSAEVKKVVELIIEHAKIHPHKSLGVIAMGINHARRIEAELDKSLKDHPELDNFFSQNQMERFFIKNLERVQGDERDYIILSIGYGKDQSGKLPYRFGPLLRNGGERRLNVAITRARYHMTVVSSFSHYDMDPNRSKSRGVELLRLFLLFAASSGRSLNESGLSGVPLNEFEADVYDTLSSQGISLLPQYGISKYRIDLVAQHPKKPGKMVLAIECDGATYHSAPTARDRDRLRQQHLEALGWKFHRIWSTDWFYRRKEEIERVKTAYWEAVKQSESTGEQSKTKSSQEDTPSNLFINSISYSQRESRPWIPNYASIDDYSISELIEIIRWIKSDGILKTDDEIKNEMIKEMGFKRRGSRIDAAIDYALKLERGK